MSLLKESEFKMSSLLLTHVAEAASISSAALVVDK